MAIKPIEIEFIPKDGVTPALGKMAQAADSFADSASAASAKAAAQIQALESELKSAKEELRRLQQQSDVASGEGLEELRKELAACRRIIDEQAEALARLKGRHQETTSTAKSLVQEQRQLTQTLAQLRVEGKQNSEEYVRMRQRLAEITDAMGDVRQEAQALAHDDQHLNAMTSGLTGLAGAATAATGVLSLFVGEQEELQRIQTRLQGVMAITMGLQQAMDALNKSSAFSTVMLAKAKTLLTTANTRLAVALGISTAAARVLMATLTLGLSAAIAGAIALYNRYSDAQATAKAKREELLQVEAKGRAESLKARFELDATMRKIKEFNGSKAEEKRLVEELNRTKGETFGYYQTLAEWYDALTLKSKDYVDALYDEHRVRALLDKAVESDEELAKIDAAPVSEYDRWSWVPNVLRNPNEDDLIARARKDLARQEAARKKEEYLQRAKQIQTEAEERAKKAGIGDHVNPEEVKRKEEEARRKREEAQRKATAERKQTQDLAKSHVEAERAAQRHIEDARATALTEQYAREREQLRLEYERRLEEINRWETQQLELIAQLRKRGYKLDPGAEDKARAQAATLRVESADAYDRSLSASRKQEADQQREALEELLQQHQDYDAKRRKIEEDYVAYVERLTKLRTEANASKIDAAIAQARKDADHQHRSVDEDEVATTERTATFLVRLYEDAGDKSIAQIKRVIAETEALLDYLKTTPKAALESRHGLSASLLAVIQGDPARLKAIQDGLTQHKQTLSSKSLSDDLADSWAKGIEAIKQGDIPKGVDLIARAANKAIPAVKQLGTALASALGDNELAEAIAQTTEALSAVVDIGSGVGRMMAGDVIGGAQALMSGVTSIISMASQAEERHQEAMRQVQAARLAYQREYNLLLLRQSMLLKEARSAFGDQDIQRAANALKVYDEALRTLKESIRGEAPTKSNTLFSTLWYDWELEQYNKGVGRLAKARIVDGHRKTGLFGWGKGEDTYASILSIYPKLINAQGELDTAQLKVILSTRKMTEETREYLQGLISQSELLEQAKEQFDSYLESTFGSLGSSMTSALITSMREGRDALEVFAEDAARVIEQMSERMIYSLHFADRFRALQDQLRAAYKAGGGERDIATRVRGLLKDFMGSMSSSVQAAQRDIRLLKETAAKEGFDLWGSAQAAQQGRSSAFIAMSQEQGTKLEGLFVAHAERLATLDEHVEAIMPRLSNILEAIQQVARNTEPISTILEEIRRIKTDGIKIQ